MWIGLELNDELVENKLEKLRIDFDNVDCASSSI